MNRRLISLILFLLILSASIPSAYALSNQVNDHAGLMTYDEIDELEALTETISASTGLDLVILAVNDLGGQSPASFADDYYDSNGYSDDGILFLLAMAERDWYISTCGEAIRIFDDRDIDALLDAGLPYFSGGDYFNGFCEVLHNVDRIASGRAVQASTHSAASVRSDRASGKMILISMVIGTAVSGIVILIMRSSMNTKRRQRGAADYLTPGSYHLRTRQDIFLYSNVTKTPRQQNTSSGGSSHMSSSGRSHGGGGTKF